MYDMSSQPDGGVSYSDEKRQSFVDDARVRNVVLALLLLLYAFVLIRTAWLSDDAYITLRTVSNLLQGYGPVWNVAERVQAYTHPLWMLSLAAAIGITGEFYYTSIFFSIAGLRPTARAPSYRKRSWFTGSPPCRRESFPTSFSMHSTGA